MDGKQKFSDVLFQCWRDLEERGEDLKHFKRNDKKYFYLYFEK